MPLNNKSAGFTLLEVMLAMTLLSIMVVLLFSSLQIAAESWNKGENKIAEVNEKAIVFRFFKQHLPSIRPAFDDFSETDTSFSFTGDSDVFQFVSVFPASANRKGLHLFEVGFDRAEESIKVMLKPFYSNVENGEWQEEEVVLLENVENFKISYFDMKASEWERNWLEKKELPALIKIEITMLDQSYWPEMILPLKLAGFNSDTRFDGSEEADLYD